MDKKTLEKYLVSPNHCPYCDSDWIDAGDHEFGDNQIWQNILCIKCGKEWTDIYKLVNAELLIR